MWLRNINRSIGSKWVPHGNSFILNIRIIRVDTYSDQQPFSFVETPVFVSKQFIQGVSKILGQTSRMNFSEQNKERSSYEHISGNVWLIVTSSRFRLSKLLFLWVNNLYRVYLKFFDEHQEWILRNKTKKEAHTNTYPEMCEFLM